MRTAYHDFDFIGFSDTILAFTLHISIGIYGGMAEWSIAPVLKTGVWETGP